MIQRLLEERRQYEAWLARVTAAADAAPEHVRTRVRADYEARLRAVTEELKAHADVARQMIAQSRAALADLRRKERSAAERLAETELRHAVGEYDETQWSQVHRDASAELVGIRQEIQAAEQDIARLEELDGMVQARPGARAATPPPGARSRPEDKPRAPAVDELAFLKSVTEDERNAPSPRRASGAQFQPSEPAADETPASPFAPGNDDAEAAKTLKCRQCGTMNLGTEWYCENCGAELAAL